MTSTWTSIPEALVTEPARTRPDLLASATADGLAALPADFRADVFAIDPELADTAALVQHYGLDEGFSINCVLVAGTRAGDERIAACMVPASTRADVNTRVRKLLDVRKASFMPMDRAVADSGMEYGGIGPIGLPEHYRLLIDSRVLDVEEAIIGSGIRGSKIILPGRGLAEIPGAEVVEGLAKEG